ncbi:hypothetical protein TWF281_009677 [Arthrobotrys megalospora]
MSREQFKAGMLRRTNGNGINGLVMVSAKIASKVIPAANIQLEASSALYFQFDPGFSRLLYLWISDQVRKCKRPSPAITPVASQFPVFHVHEWAA